MLDVYFPEFYTEYHREESHREKLVWLLCTQGIRCHRECTKYCEVAFSGSFYKYKDSQAARLKYGIPVVHYCWDIYDFQMKSQEWQEYAKIIQDWEVILAASIAVRRRLKEFIQRDSFLVRSCVRPWQVEVEPCQGDYVLDVMRKHWDPNMDILRPICNSLGLKLVETKTETPWEEFKRLVVGARVLICPNYEASTGGMTLLEGHWHGKPVLLSKSLYNGAVDYFGNRAEYFTWDDREELMRKLSEEPRKYDVQECRDWITKNLSEERFANQIAFYLKETVNQQKRCAKATAQV